MRMVKRYDVSGYGGGMIESEDGAWYHENDYREMKSAGYQLLEALGLCLVQLERESMPSDEVMHAMHHARAAICKSADLARGDQ